jgi:hypothetical protein
MLANSASDTLLCINVRPQNIIIVRPGKNRLGTDRAVFLADKAGPAKRPGQAFRPVNAGSADFDRAFCAEVAFAKLFGKGKRPDYRSRANISASDAIKLAAACADAIVHHRRPEIFKTIL